MALEKLESWRKEYQTLMQDLESPAEYSCSAGRKFRLKSTSALCTLNDLEDRTVKLFSNGADVIGDSLSELGKYHTTVSLGSIEIGFNELCEAEKEIQFLFSSVLKDECTSKIRKLDTESDAAFYATNPSLLLLIVLWVRRFFGNFLRHSYHKDYLTMTFAYTQEPWSQMYGALHGLAQVARKQLALAADSRILELRIAKNSEGPYQLRFRCDLTGKEYAQLLAKVNLGTEELNEEFPFIRVMREQTATTWIPNAEGLGIEVIEKQERQQYVDHIANNIKAFFSGADEFDEETKKLYDLINRILNKAKEASAELSEEEKEENTYFNIYFDEEDRKTLKNNPLFTNIKEAKRLEDISVIFGLTKASRTLEQFKTNVKKLYLKYHPDKATDNGFSPEIATKLFIILNAQAKILEDRIKAASAARQTQSNQGEVNASTNN